MSFFTITKMRITKLAGVILVIGIFALSASVQHALALSSANYTITDSNFGAGPQMNSTNFSISGNVAGTPSGLWTSGSLPLVSGTVTSCGKITAAGTYTLGLNLTGISGTCFVVSADNVIIDGAGFSVTAVSSNSSYAVTATSSASGANGHIVTLNNITFSNFANGVNASGSNNGGGQGGNGGLITISTSTIGNVTSNGGTGSTINNGGNGGTILVTNSTTGGVTSSGATGGVGGVVTLTRSNLDLSNNTYTSGTLNLSYSGVLTTANTNLSALSHLVVNSVDLGAYGGGAFPLIPGTINSCGTIYFSGTYTFGGNISGGCNIAHTGTILNGAGHSLLGNVTAGNYGTTLSNITVTGAVSTTGASPGALVINNASNLTGTISVTGIISGDGSSSLGNTTINAGGSVATSSVSFIGDVINNGTINSGNSVSGKTTNNSVINTGSGSFTFNASSTNSGTVNGNAILNASSTNTGTVTGNLTFNIFTANSGVNGGANTGAVSFSGTTAFGGTGYVNGNIYDSLGAQITSWIFNLSSTNTGILKGGAILNDTSRNTGTILGNTVFNNSSTNGGAVTGNADVNSPVARPLTGTISGQVVYHGYPGLYFNDSATGHGATGKWDDLNNWWTDLVCTTHAPVIPTSGDDVIVISGNIATSSIAAIVKTAVFQGSTNNGISLNVSSTSTDAVTFNASSTNSGTINGNAVFTGSDTSNAGAVNGYITRQYNSGVYAVITDFTHNGIHWIVQAINGASVDLSGATYSLVTNTFQALNNGVFTAWNSLINGGGAGTPALAISSPIAGTNIKWAPNISWGTNSLCQYKIDGGNFMSVDCSKNGADIPRPSATSHTIFFRSTDAHGNISEKSTLFAYDNTQPVWTSCGSDLLDEATRPYYYLTSNVGDCTVTASTTLRGDNNGGGTFYTAGSMTGVGTSTNISFVNVIATGTVSSFKNITVASSSLSGSIDVVGIFNSDTRSIFGNTTVESGGMINGGTFTGNVLNKTGGVIVNSTTSPVVVFGSTINNGVISGDFIFNATSTNVGTVNGNLTLNASSSNAGIVNGDLKFNTFSAVSGAVSFDGGTVFLGTGHITGGIKDSWGNVITRWIFNDHSLNVGYTIGNSFFNGTSSNASTIVGEGYFSGSSVNAGTVTGNANVYYVNSTAVSGTVGGVITYHSYPNAVSFNNASGDGLWSNPANWFTDTTLAISLGRVPSMGEEVVLFATTTLASDVTSNVYVAENDVLLNGAEHVLTGNVSGNGAYGGHNAYSFNLSNITVTGTTTAIGGDGIIGLSNGGDGGTINIDSASTGGVVVNGGDPLHNGGNAGTSTVTNSVAIVDGTKILAVGGASSGCGFGGNGGNISLVDSSGYVLVTATGADATSLCEGPLPTAPTSRTGGVAKQVGVYVSPATKAANAAAVAASNNKKSGPSSGSVDTYIFASLNATNLGKLNLTNLPNVNLTGVGDNLGVSNFVNPLAGLVQLKPIAKFIDLPKVNLFTAEKINNFFNSPLPKSLADISNAVPSIKSAMAMAGIVNGYDLYSMKNSPINTPTLTELRNEKTVMPKTLMFASVGGEEKSTKLSIDKKGKIYQIITVSPDSIINLSINGNGGASDVGGKGGVVGKGDVGSSGVSANGMSLPKVVFNGKNILSTKDKNGIVLLNVVAPKDAGVYVLNVGGLTLEVRVSKVSPDGSGGNVNVGKDKGAASQNSTANKTAVVKPLSIFQRVWAWFVR